MKDLPWFPPIPEARKTSAPSVVWSVSVGGFLGTLLVLRGHRNLAVAIWAATTFLALGLFFPAFREPISRIVKWLSEISGRLAAWMVLWPFYVIVFGATRLALSIARVDLLGLRIENDRPSYWQPAAPERKRAKYCHRLFTIEPARHESHFLAWATGILLVVLLFGGNSELILRSLGFGHPILYRVDPRVGYYPAPSQDVHRYGGEIHINAFGMRSREVAAKKPPGAFRILMLGDSTLYGGSYIGQSETYASRLEEALNREPSLLPGMPRRVEVLGMGVNGWGPQHELAYVQEFGLFQADLVMVTGPPIDAYRPRYGIEAMPFFTEGHRPRFAWQEFCEHVLWELNLRLTGAGEGLDSGPQAQAVLADGAAAWLNIASLAQAQGARLDFEFLPNETEAREGKASEATQRVLNALLPELEKRQVPSAFPVEFFGGLVGFSKLFHDGAHLDTFGHQMYAVHLRDRVINWNWRTASHGDSGNQRVLSR
jgi:hypothetical protein